MSTVPTPRDQRPGAAEGRPIRDDLGFRLGLVHRMLREAWEKDIVGLGVTPPQAAVLRTVAEGEACGLRGLARKTRTDVMNVRRLAEHLEAAGLVTIGDDPGHRQRRIVRPTVEGVAVAEEIARRATSRNRYVAGLLGEGDLATLLDLLDRLHTALSGVDPEASPDESAATGSVEHERDT